MSAVPPPGFYTDIDGLAYRAMPALNQSTLKVWLELGVRLRNPAKFKFWLDQKIDRQTDAMRLGSLVDTMILEPHMTGQRFTVWEAESRRGAKYDAFAEKAYNLGLTVVTAQMRDTAQRIVETLRKSEDLAPIFRNARKTVAVAELQGRLVKCEMDLFADLIDWLHDLKVSVSAANTEDGFGQTFAHFDYAMQGAFYLDICEALGKPREGVGFIVVEPEEPHFHNCITFPANDPRIEAARDRYRQAILGLSYHMDRDEWPSYPLFEEGVTPKWFNNRAA
jgi:exodeoxyribonuclease VIII